MSRRIRPGWNSLIDSYVDARGHSFSAKDPLHFFLAYPEMQDQDPADQTASLRAATVVLEDARTLASSVARYRLILRRPPDRADDMPF